MISQETFDAVMDGILALPTGFAAPSVVWPGSSRCREIRVHLRDEIGGPEATVRLDPTAEPAEIRARLRAEADRLLGHPLPSPARPAPGRAGVHDHHRRTRDRPG